jgi:hypothetical protein
MVIHNFNIVRISITPGEADAPLVIDSNTVAPRAVAFQPFQLISRRHAKILQPQRPMQVEKFSPRGPFDGLKSPDDAVLKERLGI